MKERGENENSWSARFGRRFYLIMLLLLLFITSASVAMSQPAGSLDTTFDGDGKATVDVGTLHNEAFAVAVQTDGKIVVAGNNVNGSPDEIVLARFQPNGTLDTSFGSGGMVVTQIEDRSGKIRAIALQPDGKIIIAGSISVGLSSGDFLLIRYNADGSFDQSFGSNGWTSTSFNELHDDIHSIALQPDGKILAAGKATDTVDVYKAKFALARYHPNGSPDTTFGDGGKLITEVDGVSAAFSVVLQPDGKIVAAGMARIDIFSDVNIALVRYNANGSLDSNFGAGGKIITDFNNRYNLARSVALQTDGKILVGGEANGGNNIDFALTRYTSAGTLDTNFGTGGNVTTNISGEDAAGETRSLAIQPDGKILIAGKAGADFGLVRYNSNGSLDSAFGTGGKVTTDFIGTADTAAALVMQPNGKIVVVGKSMITPSSGTNLRTYDFAVARYNSGLNIAPPAVPFDFDGDAKTDISIFRPSSGEWWYLKSSDGGNYAAQFGQSTDKLTPSDFTGDGKADIAFFRPNTGEWFILRSEDGSFYSFPFGANGDIPQIGDFDADGKADPAVFRPSTATWFIRKSSDGTAIIQQFGQTGDTPVVADYDGDAKADMAIYRASAGEWWINRSSLGGIAFQFGNSSDKPVQGDFTGDGKADVALFRPNTGEWFVLRSKNQSYYSFPFGTSTDIPAPGDFDGDGKFDAAVFRTSSNTWFVNKSSGGNLIQIFGQIGDKPVPGAFIPD